MLLATEQQQSSCFPLRFLLVLLWRWGIPGAGAHPPEASGTFLLVDVNEAADHPALEQAALSLHSDLGERGESAGGHQHLS